MAGVLQPTWQRKPFRVEGSCRLMHSQRPNGYMGVDSGHGGLQMQQNRQPYTQNIYAPRQPPQPFEGQITKVFESFCIMNGDIYISKAVAERQTGIWPPQLGEVARVHVVPHQRGRNNWKAVSYVSHSAMMMMSTLIRKSNTRAPTRKRLRNEEPRRSVR